MLIVAGNRTWSEKDVHSCTADVAAYTPSLLKCSNLNKLPQQTAKQTVSTWMSLC